MVCKDVLGVGRVYHSKLWPIIFAQVSEAIWHKPLAYREGVTVEAMFGRWNQSSLEYRDYTFSQITGCTAPLSVLSLKFPMHVERLMRIRVSTISRNYKLLCAVRMADGLKEIGE